MLGTLFLRYRMKPYRQKVSINARTVYYVITEKIKAKVTWLSYDQRRWRTWSCYICWFRSYFIRLYLLIRYMPVAMLIGKVWRQNSISNLWNEWWFILLHNTINHTRIICWVYVTFSSMDKPVYWKMLHKLSRHMFTLIFM
jgi:hypothetical protein